VEGGSFQGARAGYVFKKAQFGVGYYRDTKGATAEHSTGGGNGSDSSSSSSSSSSTSKGDGKGGDIVGRMAADDGTPLPDLREVSPLCREHGYVAITADGGVLKKVLRRAAHGSGGAGRRRQQQDEEEAAEMSADSDAWAPHMPVEGCPCAVQYIGRLYGSDPPPRPSEEQGDAEGGSTSASQPPPPPPPPPPQQQHYPPPGGGAIFETTRDLVGGVHIGGTDDPLQFQLLRGKWVRGADVAVATMEVGELASFVLRGDYAFGAAGLPPRVLPHACVELEVELLSFGAATPRFPSQAELADGKRRREAEERALAAAQPPPPSAAAKAAGAAAQREVANGLFRAGEYEAARKAYDSAFVHVFCTKEEWEGCLSEAEQGSLQRAKLPLHLNRAMCKLKLGRVEDAEWDCEKAIALAEALAGEPPCVKGHFRRGMVFTEKLRQELRKERDGEYWDVARGARHVAEARASFGAASAAIVEVAEAAAAAAAAADAADAAAAASAARKKEESAVKKALRELATLEVQLKRHTATYKSDQKALFRDKIIGKLDAKNKSAAAREHAAAAKGEEKAYDDMPALDDSEDDDDGQ
jgi:hypothetical protein